MFDLLAKSLPSITPEIVAQWAIGVESTIFSAVHDDQGKPYVDWQKDGTAVRRKLRFELGEKLWELRTHDATLEEATINDFERQLEGVAIANYKAV